MSTTSSVFITTLINTVLFAILLVFLANQF